MQCIQQYSRGGEGGTIIREWHPQRTAFGSFLFDGFATSPIIVSVFTHTNKSIQPPSCGVSFRFRFTHTARCYLDSGTIAHGLFDGEGAVCDGWEDTLAVIGGRRGVG